MAKDNRKTYSIDADISRILGQKTLDIEAEVGSKVYRKQVIEAMILVLRDNDEVERRVLSQILNDQHD